MKLTVRSIILRAKFARQFVMVQTDDGERLTGIVEEISDDSLKLRQEDGVMFVPVRDIEDVDIINDLGR